MEPPPTTTPANLLLRRQNDGASSENSLAPQLNTTAIIGLSVAGGALLILALCIMVLWIKKSRRKQDAAARDRLEGRKRTVGAPIPITPAPIDLHRPKYQQSIDSLNSTLADMKFDPCVAADTFKPPRGTNDARSSRTASHVNYSPSPLRISRRDLTGLKTFAQEHITQSVDFPASAPELTSRPNPRASPQPRSRNNSGETCGAGRHPIRPPKASNLSKSFSVNDIESEEETLLRRPSRVGQQSAKALDDAGRFTSPLQQVMAGESGGGPSTPTLTRNRSTVRHPGDENHLRPPKGPAPDLAGPQAHSFSHPGDILNSHEQYAVIPKPFKPFSFHFPRPAPSPPPVSSLNPVPQPPAPAQGAKSNPFAALVSAAGLSTSQTPEPMQSDASLPAIPSSTTSPSRFSFNTDLMTYNNHAGRPANNSVDLYRPVDPKSFTLSDPSRYSLQVIGGSPLLPEDLESRGLRVRRLKEMNVSISSLGTASSDPRAPSWTLETLKENLFAHRRGESSSGSVSDRSSLNVVDFQFPQVGGAGPSASGAAPGVRPQSFDINPQNPIEMRTVVQTFQTLLPDELGLCKGEQLGVLRHFDDQWCVVAREKSSSNTSAGGPPGLNGGVLEIGACPAWVFESRPPPQGFTRPMRSSSLGVTFSMRMPAPVPAPDPATSFKLWAMREEVISWSNF
jgi:hypothetical protein